MSDGISTVAVIPARGGSKGVPRKNVRPLGGKPLIVHTIQAALGASSVDRVYVSTDDAEIGQVAESAGAGVIQRPSELAGDLSSSELALLHALDDLAGRGVHPDLLVFLQCTSPFTTAEDIDRTVSALRRQQADTAFSAVPFHYFVWRGDAEGRMQGINHDSRVRPMRQEREHQFLETGSVYVMRVDGFRAAKYRFFGKIISSLIPADHAFEIDEPEDFDIAEARLAGFKKK